MAASASRSRDSGSVPAPCDHAMPTEAEIGTRWLPVVAGSARASSRRRAISAASSGRSSRSQTTMNSSPPKRATTSPGRIRERRRRAASSSTPSPTSWPSESLTTLKPSRSKKSTASPASSGRPAARRSARCCTSRVRLGRFVELVVLGLVSQDRRLVQRRERRGHLGADGGQDRLGPGRGPRPLRNATRRTPTTWLDHSRGSTSADSAPSDASQIRWRGEAEAGCSQNGDRSHSTRPQMSPASCSTGPAVDSTRPSTNRWLVARSPSTASNSMVSVSTREAMARSAMFGRSSASARCSSSEIACTETQRSRSPMTSRVLR